MSDHTHYYWPNIATFVIAEKGKDSTYNESPIQGFYRQVHLTDKDIYFDAFRRYRTSPRPIPKLVPDQAKEKLHHVPGFTSIGVLQNP